MGELRPSVTRPDFDELIARALQIQERADERVDLERARAIALELGVSAEAWEEALQERRVATTDPAAPSATPAARLPKPFSIDKLSSVSVRNLAIAGGVLGAISGFVSPMLGTANVWLGALGIGVGLAITAEGVRTQLQPRDLRVRLGAWWTSVTLGILVGIGGPHPDPIIYGVVGWLVCEGIAALINWRKQA